MRVFVDVLAWITIGLGASCAAARLVSLLAGPGHRGPERRGAHAAPRALAEPGARRAAWRELRTYLLIVATGAVWLVTQPKHRGAAEVLVVAAVVAIVAWQLGAWLTAPPGVGRGAALQEALLPALPALAWLASGWSYTRWVLIAVVAALAAPELDAWLRPRLRRKPGDAAADPP